MDKAVAVNILEAIYAAGQQLNILDQLSMQIDDLEERQIFRGNLGNAIAILGTDMVMRIVAQYPDLDPDK
jgi:hypothetical protein